VLTCNCRHRPTGRTVVVIGLACAEASERDDRGGERRRREAERWSDEAAADYGERKTAGRSDARLRPAAWRDRPG
jgi:hypothetical protein